MKHQITKSHEVFREWSLYDIVIHHNYMRHREMETVIRDCTKQLQQPLRVLDLGCGDGRMAMQGLQDRSVEAYTGVDLSTDALAAARENLSQHFGQINLMNLDLEQAMDHGIDYSPNLILASYSLHHFRYDAMQRLLGKLRGMLEPLGTFLWIDLQRKEDESRQDYLERFFQTQLSQWEALSGDQIKSVIEHISTSDFPLTANEIVDFASKSGLTWKSTPYEDSQYAGHIFQKPVTS